MIFYILGVYLYRKKCKKKELEIICEKIDKNAEK